MKIKRWLTIAVLAGGVTHAQAALIDFEDVTATGIGEPCFGFGLASVGCQPFLDSTGFRFTSPDVGYSNHAHLISTHFLYAPQSRPTNDGAQYIGYDSSILVIARIDGAAFSISGFDAAEGFLNYGSRVGFAARVRIEGSRIGGGTETVTVEFDGLNDGNGPNADFQTFALPAAFSNLNAVSFHALNAAGDPDFVYFSLDNLHVAAVPEPAECLLLTLGLGAIAGRARRRGSRGTTPTETGFTRPLALIL